MAGEPYGGALLANEVSRVIGDDGGDVGSITCSDTPAVDTDVVTGCHGVIDGYDASVKVTFMDALGHFTLVEG